MPETTSSSAKIYIGTAATINWDSDASALSSFAADTYTEVTGIEDLGEFGDEASAVEYSTLDDNRKKRKKGVLDAGTFDLVCIRNSDDAGQKKLIATQKSRGEYNIKVELNDAPTTGGTPSLFFFTAAVMSAKVSVGSADSMVKLTSTIAINSAILEVMADDA